MAEVSNSHSTLRPYAPPVASALELIERLLIDGLRHGHFEFEMKCEAGTGGRRLLIIKAGKSHRFSITESEVPS